MVLTGIFIAVLVITGAAHFGVVAWIAAAAVTFGYYRFDIWRRPLIPCRVCSGGGANESHLGGGSFFRRPIGWCWCCKGKKVHSRFAARILAPSQYRAIRSGQHSRNY